MVKMISPVKGHVAVLMTLLFVILCSALSVEAIAENDINHFDSLQRSLIKDGFNPEQVKNFYKKDKVVFETKAVARFFKHRESKLNYDQFASNRSVKMAKKYIKVHSAELEYAEKTYGVDKEVITAIISVETRLGTVLGNVSILNILSTMSSLKSKNVRDSLWKKFSGTGNVKREKFEKWADRKSKWAYKELKAFLKYVNREKLDPLLLFGSYAGAMGIAQFMPSNIIHLGKDGNKDGSVDLFNHADAIASIGNFLKHYGWFPGVTKDKAYKVIYHYNHSSYYVKIILKLAELLKD